MLDFINGFKQYIDSSAFWTLIGVVLGSILTYFLSNLQIRRNEKKELIEIANIIYFDLKKSMETLQNQKDIGRNISRNRITILIDQYPNLIVKLRSKISSGEVNNLLIYYGNISLLEEMRIKCQEVSVSEKNSLLDVYLLTTEGAIKVSHEILHIEKLLEKLKKIAKLEI